MSKETVRKVRSTQKLLPIRDIADGMIITADHRYIKILEVSPVNFLMKSAAEQNEIAKKYRDLFKAGPASLQMKAISRRADLRTHMQGLKEEILSETSPKCTEMQLAYLQLLKAEAGRGSISRRYCLIYEYEPESGSLHRPTRAEITAQLRNTAVRIETTLNACGNEILHKEDEDGQLEEILYTLLNSQEARRKTFEDHLSSVRRRYLREAGVPEHLMGSTRIYVPAADLIAPSRVDFPSKDYMVISGRYYTYAYIPGDGYNPYVITGWLSVFLNVTEGIDLDLFFSKVPREHVIFKIRQSLNQNRAVLMDASDTQASFDSLQDSVRAGQYLKDGLSNGEDFYYLSILLTISGESRKEIDWKYNEIRKMLSTMDIRIRRCSWEMKQAFSSVLPFCREDTNLWKKSKRNVLTSGAATTYPFTAYELMDEEGILFGRNTMNNSLAVVDIFNTRVYKNANIFIAGTTGAGKTFSLLLLAIRMRIRHIPVIIIAPEKEHEFERVAQAMDGQFIRFGSGSPHCINIMEIFKTDDTARLMLDGGTVVSSYLAEKVQDLKTFFKLLVPDISYEEKELLDEALMETYRKKGITQDNRSLADPEDPGRYRKMPVLGDLYEEICRQVKLARVSNIIRVLVSGSGKNFNSHTNVNLDNEFVVLGLEHLSDDLLPVGMFMAIDYAWSKIKEDRTKKKALMIDEWWRFAFDPLAADYSLKIAKTIRAYGGSLILATQQMSDIFAIENGKYGEGVLNNCKLKIIMQLEEHDALGVQKILKLTDGEKERITRFRQGEALLVANSNSVPLKFESNRKEFNLITTDRKSLEEQMLARMTDEERSRYYAKRKKQIGRIIGYLDLESKNGELDLSEAEIGGIVDIDEELSRYFEEAESLQDVSEFKDLEEADPEGRLFSLEKDDIRFPGERETG